MASRLVEAFKLGRIAGDDGRCWNMGEGKEEGYKSMSPSLNIVR
jgi:hypothetical protein